MRLIDADKLLEAISNSGLIWETYELLDVIEVLAVKKIIDDAPTVDTTFREVVAYECGQKSVEERPKGKWIEERDKRGHLIARKCPICKAYHDGMINNFCPNCGADMRGEK